MNLLAFLPAKIHDEIMGNLPRFQCNLHHQMFKAQQISANGTVDAQAADTPVGKYIQAHVTDPAC